MPITAEDIAEYFGNALIDQDNFSKTADYQAIYDEGVKLIKQFEEQVRATATQTVQ